MVNEAKKAIDRAADEVGQGADAEADAQKKAERLLRIFRDLKDVFGDTAPRHISAGREQLGSIGVCNASASEHLGRGISMFALTVTDNVSASSATEHAKKAHNFTTGAAKAGESFDLTIPEKLAELYNELNFFEDSMTYFAERLGNTIQMADNLNSDLRVTTQEARTARDDMLQFKRSL